MSVTLPYTFGPLSGNIPLSYLDSNFSALATAVNGIVLPTTGIYPQVRQTVAYGSVSSSGYPIMLSGTGSLLTLNLSATATNMVVNFAAGNTDYQTTLTTDQTAVVACPASSLSFVYAGYSSATAVSWGTTLAPPQYGYAYNQSAQSLVHFNGTAGATTFLDDFGNTWVANGGAKLQTNQVKYGSAALGGGGASNVLNGSTDYVKCTGITSLGQGGWSLRTWVYLTSLAAINAVFTAESATGFGAVVWVTTAGKTTMSLSSNNSTYDIASGVVGTTTLVANTWYFIELTFDVAAGVYRLYVNGVQDSSATSSNKVCPIAQITVGARPATPYYTTGYIDEFEFLPYCQNPAGTTYTPPASASNIATAGYASDWFSVPLMTMYTVSGPSTVAGTAPTVTAASRVYVAEAQTTGVGFTSVTNYALNGRYVSAESAGVASTTTTFSHNVGVDPRFVNVIGYGRWTGVTSGETVNGAIYGASGFAQGNAAASVGRGIDLRNINRLQAAITPGSTIDFVTSSGQAVANFLLSISASRAF